MRLQKRATNLLGLGALIGLLTLAPISSSEAANLGNFAGDTIVVPDHFGSLRDAVAAASRGDTIEIEAGTYSVPANINISKDLTIQGESSAEPSEVVLEGDEESSVITAKAGEVVLRNLTVTNGGSGPGGAVNALGTSTVTIENARIVENNTDGLVASDAGTFNLINSKVSENVFSGLFLGLSPSATVRDSQITNNGDEGIFMLSGAQLDIEDSEISSNASTGIKVDGTARIVDNRILDNGGFGISTFSGSDIEACRDNTVEGNNNGDFDDEAAAVCEP